MTEKCIPIGKVREVVQEETADLREQLEEQREENRRLQEENEKLRERVDELERRADAAGKHRETLIEEIDDANYRIGELQSLDLEKGHHIQHIKEPAYLDVASGRIEYVDGDDGEEYARLPGSKDPLERSGESVLATGDLLPIQQLAQMQDDTLAGATSKRADYIAARVWTERGQHSPGSVWSSGCGQVREYVDASDVRTYIKSELERADESLSYDYAKKLAGDALERIRELAKDRCYVERRNHRKDGLRYKERRLVVPSDADIPGEGSTSDAPGTDGVTG